MNVFKELKISNELKLLLLSAAIIMLYYFAKSIFVGTAFFNSFEQSYATFLTNILNFLTSKGNFYVEARSILSGNFAFSFDNILVIKYYFIVGIILYVYLRNWTKTTLIYLLTAFLFLVTTISRLLIERYFTADYVSFLVSLIISIRYNLLVVLLLYKLSLYSTTKLLISKWNTFISRTYFFSFRTLLIIVASVPAITGLFDWFLLAKWNLLVIYLSKFILMLSNTLLSLVGYPEGYIVGNYILLDDYWLYLGTNCLGVGLIVLFSLMILTIRSPFTNRIVYVTAGVFFILVMNATRIVWILLYIYINQVPAKLIEDYHTLSNNVFYVVVFFVILIYIRWFQHLRLKKLF